MNPIWFFIGWLGLGIICTLIGMLLKSLGMNEKKSDEIASSIVGIPVLVIIVVIFLGSIFLFPAMLIKEFWSDNYRPQTTSDYDYAYADPSQNNGFHHTSGHTREDGTRVDPYVSGNPDGIRENNVEYMRNNGDYEGVRDAYSSAK